MARNLINLVKRTTMNSNPSRRISLPIVLAGIFALCIALTVCAGVAFMAGRSSLTIPIVDNVLSPTTTKSTPPRPTSDNVTSPTPPSSTSQTLIIGSWSDSNQTIEFFDDGTVTINGSASGNYTFIDKDRVAINLPGDELVFNFQFSGNTLTLTNVDNEKEVLVFTKVTDISTSNGQNKEPDRSTPEKTARAVINALTRGSSLEEIKLFYPADSRDSIVAWSDVFGLPMNGPQKTGLLNCLGVNFETLDRGLRSNYHYVSVVFEENCTTDPFGNPGNKVVVPLSLASGKWYLSKIEYIQVGR